jgi:methylene-tetrahydromethanopterin dehydrogenase
MQAPYILHLFTPAKQASPFDVNMAADAGWQLIVPYCEAGTAQMQALTQDAIFSRGPKGVLRTGIFVGGRDALVAMDMLERAKEAMVPPFTVGVMADPSGAYTTAAAMVACVEASLKRHRPEGLKDLKVVVLGGLGPVGRIAGLMAAQAGAEVHLSSRNGREQAETEAAATANRFGTVMHGVSGADPAAVRASLADADVLLACAAAGVQVASAEDLSHARRLQVAADVNAVPPEGVAGVGVMDEGQPVAGTAAVGFGALAIGNWKYQTQHHLLLRLRERAKGDPAASLGWSEAFAMARQLLAEKPAA